MNIDDYSRSKQIQFAQSIKRRAKIYLDTRFWIILRELKTSAAEVLLNALREGVGEGTLICPISASTFMEIFKQKFSPERRIGTAKMVDELSLGASLTTAEVRIGTEVARLFYRLQGELNLYDLDDLVWTKLSYTLGYLHPHHPAFNAEENLFIQKGVFDEIWRSSLTDMVNTIGYAELPDDGFKNSAEIISNDIAKHAATIKSYKQAYRDEVRGAADACRDIAAGVMCGMAERTGIAPPAKGSPQWEGAAQMASNAIVAALLKRPQTAKELRTIHVGASLHAALRWNRGRKFKANDYYDFEHAQGGLSYCDAFFTEKPLRDLVTAGHTRLNELNGCRVSADIEEAIGIVRELRNRNTDRRQ